MHPEPARVRQYEFESNLCCGREIALAGAALIMGRRRGKMTRTGQDGRTVHRCRPCCKRESRLGSGCGPEAGVGPARHRLFMGAKGFDVWLGTKRLNESNPDNPCGPGFAAGAST